MEPVKYVDQNNAQKAQELENKLRLLPPESGVIFAGVKAEPAEKGKSKMFLITLGVSRKLGVGIGRALVEKVFEEEISNGMRFAVNTVEGSPGACRDEDSQGPGPLQA